MPRLPSTRGSTPPPPKGTYPFRPRQATIARSRSSRWRSLQVVEGTAMKRSSLAALGALALSILACALPFAPTVEDRTEPSGVDSGGASGGFSGGSAAGELLLPDGFSGPAAG